MKNCLWCCFVVMFFSADALHAQIQDQVVPQSVVGKEVSEPEKPKGIPTIEISSRAQQTRIALNKLRGSLEHVSDILTIQEQLPSLLYSLQRLRSSWLYKSLNSLSTRKLQDIDNEWTIHLEKLNAWEGKLSGRTGELEENNRQLNEMEELWLITREVVVKNEAPEVILERVQSTLDEIKEIKAVYSERIKDLLIYQDKISEQQLEIKKLISLINRAEAQSRKHLFARSSLPLWKAVQADDARLNFVSQIRLSCTGFVLMNMDYIQSNRGRCFLHIIIFAALLAFMIYFYHCNRHNQLFDEKDEIFKISAFFISCPFSTVFLISIFFGAIIYTNAPVPFRELITLLALAPTLRLTPGIFISELRKPIYVLTGICFLNILESIAVDYVLLQRLLLFLITVIAVPLLIWWLRPGSKVYQIQFRLSFLLAISLGFLSLILSLISLATNVIGIFPLGHVLVSGMVKILYASVAIYAIAVVLDGFVALLVRRRNAQVFHIVQAYARQMERNAIFFIHSIIVFFWLRMTLRTFGLYQPLWEWFAKMVKNTLTIGTVNISAGAVFSFILILFITFVLARVVRVLLEVEIFSRFSFPRGVPGAISMLARYAIIGFGFFLALSAVGVDLGKFGLLAGAMGVGLGFGLRNIIENFVSGLIIIFERPIEVGDTVEIGAVMGNVEKIGMRSSTVKTFDGSEVIVPNAHLISNQVSNWTLSDRQRRIQLPVKVAFGNDPHKVLELLLKVSREHPGVLKLPEPMAIFNGFGDNYLDFMLNYWVSENILQTKSEMALNVHDIIKEFGIDTPRPKGDFNLKIVGRTETCQKMSSHDSGN